jgi:hypothetical protein
MVSEIRPRSLSEDLTWAIRLVRQGNDEARIVAALSRRHRKYGYHSIVFGQLVAERGAEAAKRYAERTAAKALRIAENNPRVMDSQEARVRLMDIISVVDMPPWPDELVGARRALEAALLVAWERGRVANLKLDLRTHAMRAGQSFAAIRKHRRTLDDLGWMKRNRRDRHRRTSRFAFYNPSTCNRPSGSFYVQDAVFLGHDAYRPGGLGDRGWYEHLIQQKSRSAPNDETLLEALDLIALRTDTYNTGYREGMGFLKDRAARAELITCASADDAA